MVSGYQNGTIAQLLQAIIGQINFDGEPISNIGNILLSILEQTPYDDEPKSVLAELFLKLKDKLEGRAFTPYDKEPKSVIAEILLSILNETEYDKEPNSRIAELLLELKAELESYAEITTSGAIANFTTSVVKPLVNLKAYFEATGGGGTPQAPIAISGVSAVSVGHQSGALDVATCFRGLFKGTHGFINLGSFTWNYSTEGSRFVTTTAVSDISLAANFTNLVANGYNTISSAVAFSQMQNLDLKRSGSTGYINIRDDSFEGNATAFKNAMNSVYLIYELATPVTPTITPEQYQALCTAFGINGSTTLVNLGGTYYGGYVEQDKDGKRELVATHGLFEFDGSNDEEWNKYTVNTDQTMWRTSIPERKSGELAQTGNIDSICNRFERAANTSTGRIQGKYAGALTYFDVIYNDVSDLTAWRTWLANNPIQLAVELAEPFTVALPDGEPIIAFNGVNNVWSDSGDTSVTYLAKIEDNLRSTAKFRANLKTEKQKLKEQKELKELEEKEIIKEPIKEIGETKK